MDDPPLFLLTSIRQPGSGALPRISDVLWQAVLLRNSTVDVTKIMQDMLQLNVDAGSGVCQCLLKGRRTAMV